MGILPVSLSLINKKKILLFRRTITEIRLYYYYNYNNNNIIRKAERVTRIVELTNPYVPHSPTV